MLLFKFYHRVIVSRSMATINYKSFLTQQFLKAVDAVNPTKLIEETIKMDKGKLLIQDHVYDVENKNLYIIGFGKAVLGMAAQCERILGKQLKKGVICVPENIVELFQNRNEYCLTKNSPIDVYEGARNNLPDEKAEKGCNAAIELIKSLNCENDNIIILISGGGSALFPKPAEGLNLQDVYQTTSLLSSSGANINELNTVRKRLSKVKGGGLARLCYPIKTFTLILSDVINDPLEIIASGPTVPNFDNESDAINIIKRYKLEQKIPKNVTDTLLKTTNNINIPVINNNYCHVDNFIIGNNSKALNASKIHAENNGVKSVIFSDCVSGSVENVAELYHQILVVILNNFQNNSVDYSNLKNLIKTCSFSIKNSFIDELMSASENSCVSKNICVVSGGEVTVTVQGKGKGGRNQELALIMSKKLYELRKKFKTLFEKYNILFLSAGTDGIDGPTDAAGAIVEAYVVEEALKKNLDINEYLLNNDSYTFFSKLESGSHLIKTGHTGTNVMDIHLILIHEKKIKP